MKFGNLAIGQQFTLLEYPGMEDPMAAGQRYWKVLPYQANYDNKLRNSVPYNCGLVWGLLLEDDVPVEEFPKVFRFRDLAEGQIFYSVGTQNVFLKLAKPVYQNNAVIIGKQNGKELLFKVGTLYSIDSTAIVVPLQNFQVESEKGVA